MRALAHAMLGSLILLNPVAIAAQEQPTTSRVPVTVAVVDHLPDPNIPFSVQRRSRAPHNMILLGSKSTARDLSAAISQYLLAHQAMADGISVPAETGIRIRGHGTPSVSTSEIPWAERVFNDLKRADQVEIPGLGRVAALVIWLPSQSRN